MSPRGYRDEDDPVQDVTIEKVFAKAETAKALLVEIDGEPGVWIPQSVISEDSEVYKRGDEGKLVVRRWFAEREGLV